MLTYKVTTNKGTRDHNEDSATYINSNNNHCIVVADGLGGHGKGEAASQKAVEVFEKIFNTNTQTRETTNETFLNNAFTSAQSEILAMQQTQGNKFGMKTTAVCLSIIDDKCQWGHIGDSRLYAFSKNKLKTRTLDHSVPQMLVLSGELKEKHISTHPDRNRLLRVIGVEWDSPRYELSDEFPLSDYQAFLLCSDGFWEYINPKLMSKFLKKSKTADEWLSLMTAAVEKNGQDQDMDNYTAIAVMN